jgi:hypothetical protein
MELGVSRRVDGPTHKLGTGVSEPGEARGLSGEALMLEEFKKIVKGTLSWRPETAQIIYDTTGWRKRSDGKVVALAEWHSVCPSDLRTLAQKLEPFWEDQPGQELVRAGLQSR